MYKYNFDKNDRSGVRDVYVSLQIILSYSGFSLELFGEIFGDMLFLPEDFENGMKQYGAMHELHKIKIYVRKGESVMFVNETMLERFKETYKRIKGFGIVLSILMILLGFSMFFVPASAAVIAMWLMTVGLLLRGISDIVTYFNAPKEMRDGWNLASGIIWVIIAISLIAGGLSASLAQKLVVWGNFEMLIGFMVGFTALFNGIKTICSVKEVKAMGGSSAICVVSGILGIIVGLIVLSYPIGSVITLTVFYGLFLIIGGISLLCKALAF